MPVPGLGTRELIGDTAGTVANALQLGYRMIDTACDYGSQAGIGDAIRRVGVDRGSIYLVGKIEESDDAYEATRQHLGNIGVGHAELMLIHRPAREDVGARLWKGLQRARGDGLARDIGVSNFSIEQMQALEQETGELPVVNQIEWSPFGYSQEMLDFCRANRIVIQAHSPLTRALRFTDQKLAQIAQRYGKSAAQILIRWNLQRGTVPLPKANQNDHLQENIAVFDFELREPDVAMLNDLNERYSSLGSLPYV